MVRAVSPEPTAAGSAREVKWAVDGCHEPSLCHKHAHTKINGTNLKSEAKKQNEDMYQKKKASP